MNGELKANILVVVLFLLAATIFVVVIEKMAYPHDLTRHDLIGDAYAIPVDINGCGIEPLKPSVPLGCRDLELQCLCDQKGEKCHWQWRCVR